MGGARAIDPRACGIGLRSAHLSAFAAEDERSPLTAPWLEIHAENFMCAGGPRLAMLRAIAERYPLSCHSVALSLGAAQGVDAEHLARLKRLIGIVDPVLVSDHLAWTSVDGYHVNDLLPLPYTNEALEVAARNIAHVQDTLGRRLLIENPSRYVAFAHSPLNETDFLAEIVARTGCGLLLDINNIHVSAHNMGFDARDYLRRIPAAAVGEIHLAGHARCDAQPEFLIDTHDRPVADEVWALFRFAVGLLGPRPTLIEWDNEVPELPRLVQEMTAAQEVLSP